MYNLELKNFFFYFFPFSDHTCCELFYVLMKPKEINRPWIRSVLTCSTFTAVMSAVCIAFAVAMYYVPIIREINAVFEGPYMCTTKEAIFNVTDERCTWSSCVDWCLNRVRFSVLKCK